MAFCTGIATSTLGAGGGTKVFCSQALNAANAIVTRARRKAAEACCKRKGFISVPQSNLVLEGACSKKACRHPINSNNPLAVKPETENDAPAKVVRQTFMLSLRLKR